MFYALRTLTSKEVDDGLATRKTFRDLVVDDPIGLLAEIMAFVTLKYRGITLRDQELASTEFYAAFKAGEAKNAVLLAEASSRS